MVVTCYQIKKKVCKKTKLLYGWSKSIGLELLMKKLTLALLLFVAITKVDALPVRNPADAALYRRGLFFNNECCVAPDACFSWTDNLSFRLGFSGDYVFDRKMETDQTPYRPGTLAQTKIYTSAGYIALNYCNCLELFSTLGATRMEWLLIDPMLSPLFPSQSPTAVFKSGFSWGVGANLICLQCDYFTVGLEGEYFQTHPELSYITLTGIYPTQSSITYHEWQVGAGISSILCFCDNAISIVPYLAIKVARAKSTQKFVGDLLRFGSPVVFSDIVLPSLRSTHWLGYAIGATFSLREAIGITVEGRWVDETALSVNGTFRF